jgi:integrase
MEYTERDVGVTTIKASPYFYVTIPGRGKKYVSSKQTTRKKAVAWALAQATGRSSPDVLLGVYAKDFFIPGSCPRVELMEGAHGKNTLKHWDTLRQLFEDYVLPGWGETMLAAVEPAQVLKWLQSPSLLTVRAFAGEHRPLSVARRNTLLVVLNHIYDQAVFELVLPGNPLRSIPGLVDHQEKVREIFTDAEIAAMFPASPADLDKLWGSRQWALLFMVLADTGCRPSEVLALRWKDWHPTTGGFVVAERIDSAGKAGPLKTSRKGIKRKVALVGYRTKALLEDLWAQLEPGDLDLIFPASRMTIRQGQPMRVAVAGNHFCDRLDKDISTVKRKGRTLYCLRHTANTGFVTDFGDDTARLLMGHTTKKMTETYDHPEDAELMARAARAVGR